tara:strand:+ start:80 stop:328 length:249 start_codon:yes stop_codon:yes gene_type:complete
MANPSENRSYVGNIPTSAKRHEQINNRLKEMVAISTAPQTQAEIAEFCGMSKQMVYQIEKKALRKIAKKFPDLLQELSLFVK